MGFLKGGMENSGQDWVHVVDVIDALILCEVGIAPCRVDDPSPLPPIPPSVRGPKMPRLTADDEQWLAEVGVLWEHEERAEK